MKAVILAGGRGTRLSEETQTKPKPLVEAGSNPLLWHVMQNYSRFGINEFVILAGYRGQQIREYFANFWLHKSDITFDLTGDGVHVLENRALPWKVTVLDTGLDTQTGGRLSYVKSIVDEEFCLTYGDGVADVDISALIETHHKNQTLVTLTAVQPPARFGALNLSESHVVSFEEKPTGDGGWINGGFFVMNSKVLNMPLNQTTSFEADCLPVLAQSGELGFYKHFGYWQPVDSLRDLHRLEEAIEHKVLPWT